MISTNYVTKEGHTFQDLFPFFAKVHFFVLGKQIKDSHLNN